VTDRKMFDECCQTFSTMQDNMKRRKAVWAAIALGALLIASPPAWSEKHGKGHKIQPDENITTEPQAIDATHENWMAQNKEALKRLPINRVPLLGSHDAGSCDVRRGNPPCKGYLTHSGHHLTRKPSSEDVTSARCQSAAIIDQLRYGVRYLDLRIAHQDNAYWIEHMWMSTPLLGEGGVFAQIKGFLRGHPDEIIVLNMQQLWSEKGEMTAKEASAFFRVVQEEFQSLLAPAGDFSSTTLGSVWDGTGRLIVIGRVDRSPEPFLWDEGQVDSQWMDANHPETLIQGLNAVVASWHGGQSAGKLRVLQSMTTTKHKITGAAKTNERIKERLKSDWKNAPLNVVQVDDSVNSGLMPLLVERLR